MARLQKRGRPTVSKDELKDSKMTVCLTRETKKKLSRIAKDHKPCITPAALARQLIENGVQ